MSYNIFMSTLGGIFFPFNHKGIQRNFYEYGLSGKTCGIIPQTVRDSPVAICGCLQAT